MADPYIKLEHITKSFDSVYANKDISVDVYKGEILALLGENGSGKSTLVNMLSGIYTPDSGTISIDGKKMHFGSPGDAIKAGIGMVHQHFKLVDVMTAAENVVMGHIKHFVTSKKRMSRLAMVDFPEPDGPTRNTNSPSLIVKLIPLRAAASVFP